MLIHNATWGLSDLDPSAVLVTDPPYSARVHSNQRSNDAETGQLKNARKRDLGFAPLSDELAVALRAQALLSSGLIFSGWDQDWPKQADAVIPWVRWSSPQFSGDRPPSCLELICYFGAIEGKQFSTRHWKCMRGKAKHDTQKPLALMLDLVYSYTSENDTILDPCAGRGTTLLAAKLLGRKWIGFEQDYAECYLANRRLTDKLDDRDAEAYNSWLKSIE